MAIFNITEIQTVRFGDVVNLGGREYFISSDMTSDAFVKTDQEHDESECSLKDIKSVLDGE